MCIPVGRKGDWLTPSVEAPSSSQISDSQKLQQESYTVPSGSIWGKMTYTEKYVISPFKNFKLYLKQLLSCPVICTQLQCHNRAWRENCRRPCPERFRLTEMAPVLTLLVGWDKTCCVGQPWGGSYIPPELAASQKLQDSCPWPASSHVLFPYFKSWNSRGERDHFPLHR